jgi:hypothetical protein
MGGGQSDSAAGKACGSFDHIFIEGQKGLMVLSGSQMKRVGKVETLALPGDCLGDHRGISHLDIG